jgi:hypothetical protein
MARSNDAEEATAARDFTMARILAARAALKAALDGVDELALLFVQPAEDKSGKKRTSLLEEANAACGDAAASIQLAMTSYDDVNPAEEEPEPGDDDDEEEEDEEDDDDDDDEDDDDGRPRRGKR